MIALKVFGSVAALAALMMVLAAFAVLVVHA
jgi:hypothetical protein